jgi:hypothetical protein
VELGPDVHFKKLMPECDYRFDLYQLNSATLTGMTHGTLHLTLLAALLLRQTVRIPRPSLYRTEYVQFADRAHIDFSDSNPNREQIPGAGLLRIVEFAKN